MFVCVCSDFSVLWRLKVCEGSCVSLSRGQKEQCLDASAFGLLCGLPWWFLVGELVGKEESCLLTEQKTKGALALALLALVSVFCHVRSSRTFQIYNHQHPS